MNVAHEKVILLVEDNPDDVDLTLAAFRKAQIANQVVLAKDGVEALDYLFGTGAYSATRPAPPQVVLLDLKLPKVDGLEVLQRIRTDPRTRLFPVVILTSSRQEQDLIRSYELGANSYVQKPVDFEQFMDAARQLGLYWLILNLSPPSGVP
jgi:two-component system response regulator